MPDNEKLTVLDNLERLLAEATSGPLRTGPINYADIYSSMPDRLFALVPKGYPETVATAQLIVALVNHASILLRAARALQRAVPHHNEGCAIRRDGPCDCGKAEADAVLAELRQEAKNGRQ